AEGSVGDPANGVVVIDCAATVAAGNQPNTGPQVPGSRFYNVAWGTALSNGWSAVTHDLSPRCWIVASISEQRLWIWNLENPGTWTYKTTSGSPTAWVPGCGAVYHAPSRSILVGGTEVGGNLRKLSISGTNPLTASYTWSNVGPAGGPIPTPGSSGYQGTF